MVIFLVSSILLLLLCALKDWCDSCKKHPGENCMVCLTLAAAAVTWLCPILKETASPFQGLSMMELCVSVQQCHTWLLWGANAGPPRLLQKPHTLSLWHWSCELSLRFSVTVSVPLSVCFYLCPTGCLFPCLSVSVCSTVCLPICLSLCSTVCLHVFLSLCPTVCLSPCLSVSVYPTVCLSVSISVPLSPCLSQSLSLSHCLPVCPIICLFPCLSASVSVCISFVSEHSHWCMCILRLCTVQCMLS